MLQKHVLKYKTDCKQNTTIFSFRTSKRPWFRDIDRYKIMVDYICLNYNDVNCDYIIKMNQFFIWRWKNGYFQKKTM